MSGAAVVHERPADGLVSRLVINRPKGNIVDREVCDALVEKLAVAGGDTDAGLLVLTGAGDHFSFGASVEEHLPDKAAAMLEGMRAVVVALTRFPYPTLAAVRGRCLGGGLELALACDFFFAEANAVLAAPEIRLGVFAPLASALLSGQVPDAVASEILLTGRDIGADEAHRWGLVSRVVEPGGLDAAVDSFVAEAIRPRSRASLRVALRAMREARHRELEAKSRRMEQIYLDDLLALADGTEGIRAFLEKRQPQWKNG